MRSSRYRPGGAHGEVPVGDDARRLHEVERERGEDHLAQREGVGVMEVVHRQHRLVKECDRRRDQTFGHGVLLFFILFFLSSLRSNIEVI